MTEVVTQIVVSSVLMVAFVIYGWWGATLPEVGECPWEAERATGPSPENRWEIARHRHAHS